MKAAFVKQVMDSWGPWSSLRWDDINPRKLCDFWPGKATYWQMTCLLRADWYIIKDPCLDTDYIKNVRKDSKYCSILSKYTHGIIQAKDIPFEHYDVIISIDPILRVPKKKSVLFAYYLQEHWDSFYKRSLSAPINNYDLFLAHMLDAANSLDYLPKSLSFPYLYDPDSCQEILGDVVKKEAIWADWRFLTMLGMSERWSLAAEMAAKRLEEVLELPIKHSTFSDETATPLGIVDPPRWGDMASYYKAMGSCKYYLGLGRDRGPGQGLCEAASVNCICIGSPNLPYHRIICHPSCLCSNLLDLKKIINRICNSSALQEEILMWQKKAILEYFMKIPLEKLERALRIKNMI